MGTTAFVGFRLGDKVRGFSVSGGGYYASIGINVLTKYEQLTNEEMKDFFQNRLTFLDYETADEETQQRIEDELVDMMYEIWNMDWKTDTIEIEDGVSMVGENCYSREYGYVFNLNDDTVEVYKQGEVNWIDSQNWKWVNEPHKLIITITRQNLDRAKQLFAYQSEISRNFANQFGTSSKCQIGKYEQLFMDGKIQ